MNVLHFGNVIVLLKNYDISLAAIHFTYAIISIQIKTKIVSQITLIKLKKETMKQRKKKEQSNQLV